MPVQCIEVKKHRDERQDAKGAKGRTPRNPMILFLAFFLGVLGVLAFNSSRQIAEEPHVRPSPCRKPDEEIRQTTNDVPLQPARPIIGTVK
jgi:hypothetical protein